MNVRETEKDAMDKLKRRMKQHMEPDMYEDDSVFFRFLKARDFNVDLAETMLRNHLEWRKKNDVKHVLKTKHLEVLTKYFFYETIGCAKEGYPVKYGPVGNIDWLGMAHAIKEEDLMKRMIRINEEDIQLCKAMSKKLGKAVEQCVHIFDCHGLTLNKVIDKTVIIHTIKVFVMYQNNYPEMLKCCYIINASMYFSLIYAAVKTCVASSIMSKVKIYYDDSYKVDLLNEIDADVLPAFLGGTRTDPDGNVMCNTFIYHGSPIPESYYKRKSKRPLSSTPGVQKVALPRAAFHEIVLEVKEPGSHLEWEFETKSRDIGFGLFQVISSPDGAQNHVELIPISRIDTEEYAETGLYLCEKAGNYIMVFDNTYSWIRSKELFYRIKILKPGEQDESGL